MSRQERRTPSSAALRNRRYRDRLRGGPPVVPRLDPDLWANATMVGDCLEWQRGRSNGYGYVYRDGRKQTASHVALEIVLGRPLAAGMQANHTCDNPPCIRPDHLYEGSPHDNNSDMVARGRARGRCSSGRRSA